MSKNNQANIIVDDIMRPEPPQNATPAVAIEQKKTGKIG